MRTAGLMQHARRPGTSVRSACAARNVHARRLQHVAPRAAASTGAGAFPSLSPQQDTEALKDFKVLVAGATGGVGKRVVEVLVEQGVPVRALVRDLNRARALLPVSSGLVEIVKADVIQYASLPGALKDCNAIICTTGTTDIKDPFGAYNLHQGVANLVALGSLKKVKKFVLVTSIGTDDIINPLNLFWGVLFWKKREEETLQRSGLDYTIVRPGGLKDQLASGQTDGNVVMKPPGYYGLPPSGREKAGDILRRQVAEVCVASLTEQAASNKVVEIIATKNAPQLTYAQMFNSVIL